MATLNPYLNFNGKCREAMTHYHQCLGGEISMQTFGDSPVPSEEGTKDLIMHATLIGPGFIIMASDGRPDQPVKNGDSIWMSLNCESQEEQDRIWKGLSEGGFTVMDLQDTFWGARFGMLTDRFGIGWMLNFETAKQSADA